jgi:O-antigen/teichoic acid export membrane protein
LILKTNKAAFKANITSTIERVISGLSPIILIPLYVKYLTIEEYGIWLIILSITSLIYLTNFGILQVITNAIAKEISEDKVDYYSKVASSGFFLFLKITLSVLGLITILFLIILASSKTISEQVLIPFGITIVSLLLTFPFHTYRHVLRGLDLIHVEQIALIIFGNLTRYIAIILSLISGLKLITLACIFAVTSFLPSLGAKVYLKKILPRFSISRKNIDTKYTKSILKPSGHFFILMIAASFLYGINTLVIGSIMGPSAVPGYAIPMQIMVLILFTIGIVSMNKMPYITRKYKQKKLQELKSIYNSLILFTFLTALWASINLIFFGEIIIIMWAGETVFYGNDLLYLMIFWLLTYSLNWPSDAILNATENHVHYSYVTLIQAILNITLTIILTYKYGIIGTISGTIIAHMITNYWFLIYKTLKVIDYKPRDFFLFIFKDILLPTIILLVAVSLISYLKLLLSFPLYLQILFLNLIIFIVLGLVSSKNFLKVYNVVVNN